MVDHPGDLYMVTATTLSRFEAIELIRQIRETYPKSLILVGGPHFSNCVEDTLKNVPEINAVVRGEGEITAVQFVKAVDHGEAWETLPGISIRKGIDIIHNEPQTIYQDLDEIDSLADIQDPRYRNIVVSYPDEDIKAASIMTSRGCPHNCVFCSMADRKIRYRNPSRVVDEMEYVGEKYGIYGFNFFDASLTGRIKHVQNICEEIVTRKLNIKWWAESRVDIPLEMIALMKQAGCVSIQVGVESGSDKVLRMINKRITRDQVIAFCKRCNDLEIYVKPLYMLSLPGEHFYDAFQTFSLSKSLARLSYVIPAPLAITQIYPKTALETTARKSALLPPDFHWYQEFNNQREINRRLNCAEDHFAHVPVFIDAMGPGKLATMIKLDKAFESWGRGMFKPLLLKLLGRQGVKWIKSALRVLRIRQ